MSDPVIDISPAESAGLFTQQFVAELRARGPEVQASWPWQESPERWVDRVRDLVAEATPAEVYLDTAPGGGGVLRFRVDGAVLCGPRFTPEQHQRLLAEIKKQSKVREPTAERPLAEGRLTARGGEAAGDIGVGWLQTSLGAQITLYGRSPFPAQAPWEAWPEQARQALQRMRCHPQGLIVFFNHGWSMLRGEMVRVLHAWAQELQGEGRVAYVTDNPPLVPAVEAVISVRVDGSRPGWEAMLRALVAQGFDVIGLAGRNAREVASQAALTALEDRMVLVNVSMPALLAVLPWLFSQLQVDGEQLAEQLVGLLGTRRLRRVCPHCATAEPIDAAVVSRLKAEGVTEIEPEKWVRGTGCRHCHGVGFTPDEGWFDLAEAVYVDRDMARLCATRPEAPVLRAALAERGFQSYLEQAVARANEGHTTIQEAIRVGLARRADL